MKLLDPFVKRGLFGVLLISLLAHCATAPHPDREPAATRSRTTAGRISEPDFVQMRIGAVCSDGQAAIVTDPAPGSTDFEVSVCKRGATKDSDRCAGITSNVFARISQAGEISLRTSKNGIELPLGAALNASARFRQFCATRKGRIAIGDHFEIKLNPGVSAAIHHTATSCDSHGIPGMDTTYYAFLTYQLILSAKSYAPLTLEAGTSSTEAGTFPTKSECLKNLPAPIWN